MAENYDLIVVGAGPAGISAAINAESERLETAVVDASERIGGQAGTSSLIENYPGFPDGISGDELMGLMAQQARRFTTEFNGPTRITDISRADGGLILNAEEDGSFVGKTALLATGVQHRQLKNVTNLSAFLGIGAAYGSPIRTQPYDGKKVIVIGGANSAGQAAHHLSEFDACSVHLVVRGESIEDKMSGYLVDKLAKKDNVEVHTHTELKEVDGDERLSEVVLTGPEGDFRMEIDELFIMIGAAPKTLWLPKAVLKDDQGFVVTGSDIPHEAREAFREETQGRSPFAHETTMPGLFAAGDIRCGTTKRVAFAIGDGASVVPELHRYLSNLSANNAASS